MSDGLHRVTDLHRPQEPKTLAEIDHTAVRRQFRPEGRRNEPGAQHPVGDALAEARFGRVTGVLVQRISVPGNLREETDVFRRHRLFELRAVADFDAENAYCHLASWRLHCTTATVCLATARIQR